LFISITIRRGLPLINALKRIKHRLYALIEEEHED
jgi:hypothetical protein